MELLLKNTIEHLGKTGDVVDVKPGYARNYLFPRGMAVMVTKSNIAEVELARKNAIAEEEARLAGLKDMASKLGEVSITIEGKANDEGHLFGSVSAAQIAESLREKGVPVEDKQVRLEHPIKEIGVYDVIVHLHAEVESQIKVWVVQQKPE